MSSKVTAKLRLGVAFSVLLISLALLSGCKQEADNSYTPPGYGASVGPFTDTVWKNGSDTIRFGAEGKVTTVPDSWKKDEFPGLYLMEYGDFTYSGSSSGYTIHAKVTNVQAEKVSGFDVVEKGTIFEVATFTVPTTTTTNQYGQSVTNYYEMKVAISGEPSTTFTMENKPTSGDKFVGTYYDEQGRKKIQINKDGTFVEFTDGGQDVRYWQDKYDGTISVQSTPFTNNPGSMGGSTPEIYYLYPHALMKSSSAVAWK